MRRVVNLKCDFGLKDEWMRLLVCLLGSLSAFMSSVPAEARNACSAAYLPRYPICREAGRALVLATTPEDADWGVTVVTKVEARFDRYFGTAPRFVLMLKDGETELSDELAKIGYRRQLVWNSPRTHAARTVALITGALRDQFRRDGLAEPEIRKRVEPAERQFLKDGLARTASTVGHELGHALLQSFWEEVTPKFQHRYGTLGPDWLDEIAAILMESEEVLQSRRMLLREMWKQGRLISLPRYLEMPHPNAIPASKRAPAGVTSGELITHPGGNGDPVLDYYAQSLGFADFLVEKSGQPLVFKAITDKLSGGWTIEEWLAAEGSRYGLGSNIAALNQQWEAWLALRN